MKTLVPVFLKIEKETSLEKFNELLQTCGLSYIVPRKAICLDKDGEHPCFAFYMDGQNQQDLANQIQVIIGFSIGKIEFISVNLKGQDFANCSVFIYNQTLESVMGKYKEVIEIDEPIYFVEEEEINETTKTLPLTKTYSFWRPQTLSFLEYSKKVQEDENWRQKQKNIEKKTAPKLKELLSLAYFSI